jgi:hypothetical protein
LSGFAHLRCHGASPHYCLEALWNNSRRILPHTDGNVQRQEREALGLVVACPETSVNAGHTKYAAQVLQEQWSIVDDSFRSEAATVHRLKKRSQPYDSQAPASKRLCAPRIVPAPPKPELGQQCSQPVVHTNQLSPHAISLSLSDVLAVYNATR